MCVEALRNMSAPQRGRSPPPPGGTGMTQREPQLTLGSWLNRNPGQNSTWKRNRKDSLLQFERNGTILRFPLAFPSWPCPRTSRMHWRGSSTTIFTSKCVVDMGTHEGIVQAQELQSQHHKDRIEM
jgi:hypothetical protein